MKKSSFPPILKRFSKFKLVLLLMFSFKIASYQEEIDVIQRKRFPLLCVKRLTLVNRYDLN